MNLILKMPLILIVLLFFGFSSIILAKNTYSQEVLESKQFKLFLLDDSKENTVTPTPKPIRYSLSKQEYDEFQKNGLITRPLGEQKKLQVQFGSLSTQLNQDDIYEDVVIRSINEIRVITQNAKKTLIETLYKNELNNTTYNNSSAPSNLFFLKFVRKSTESKENISGDKLYVFIQNPNE